LQALLFTAVDRRVKVDEMPAAVARRLQRDLDIFLAIKGADIADIAVVVDDGVDIRGLGSADTLQMHGRLRTGRAALDIERECGRVDPEASRLLSTRSPRRRSPPPSTTSSPKKRWRTAAR
jgi:hypothetical protein